MRFRLALALLLALPPALCGQTASVVFDPPPSTDTAQASSLPEDLLAFNGKVFFSAAEPGSGRELWVSDGQDRGTRLLADFCPGQCDSSPVPLGASATAAVGYTRIRDHFDTLAYLWRSDGTRDGTYLLPEADDPVAIRDFFDTPQQAFVGNVLYLAGCTRAQGCGLWRSDGTRGGTRPLAVFDDGSFPFELTAAGDRLFFLHGGLWVSDGTAAGTRKVADAPAARRLAALGNRIFFLDGKELWTSDGTAAGTRAVYAFQAPEPFQQTFFLKAMGGRIWFVADDVVHGAEIWSSDGTTTRQETEIGFHDPFAADPFDDAGLRPTDLELLGDRLVFWATDGIHGFQPWVKAGATTAPLCTACSFANPRAALVKVGPRLLFAGREPQRGVLQLWATNGTPQGTVKLRDGLRFEPLPLLGKAFFTVSLTGTPFGASELWTSDGTPQGTRRFATPGSWNNPDFGLLPALAAVGGTVFYAGDGADDDYGIELWASDGTPAGTRIVTDIARNSGGSGSIYSTFSQLTPVGRDLFFAVCSSGSQKYAYTAGTPETTRLADAHIGCGLVSRESAGIAGAALFVREEAFGNNSQLWRLDAGGAFTQLTSLPADGHISNFGVLGGRVYFMAGSSSRPWELWTSDGTSAGTAKVADIPGRGVFDLGVAGGALWFFVGKPEPDFGSALWRSDGTAAGTRQVYDFGRHATANLEFAAVGSTVFFTGPDDEDHAQLWRTDGTAAGTVLVRDLDPSDSTFDRADPEQLTAWNGALYFIANSYDGNVIQPGRALWRSDGTAAGTVLLKTFAPGSEYPDPIPPVHLAPLPGGLVLAADDGVHGRELWRTDGTAAGTVLLRDLVPGAGGSGIDGFAVAGGAAFFSADDGVHGFELWRTDGTAGGTRLVQDLAPEGSSSFPQSLTVADDRLFFLADDGTGAKLWVLPLAGPPCQPSATSLCLAGGRFSVSAAWRDFAGHTGAGRAAPLSADTGYFWFFDPANVETVVKVLDGQAANGHFWVFYGALSNVEYTLTVTDTRTGLARRYFNPKGVFASVGDTQGFGVLGAHDSKLLPAVIASPGPAPLTAERVDAAAATGTCVPAAGRLCLNGGRFAVTATWKDFSNRTGAGTAVPLTGDTGYFWFFDPANVEAVIKVLDATAVNGHFWVYYGALSNVEYTLQVTDTVTGAVRTYTNPKGRFASVGDTGAFTPQRGSQQP